MRSRGLRRRRTARRPGDRRRALAALRRRPPATLVGGAAEHLLGTSDDVALRSGVRSFVAAERVPYGFDNGQQQSRARIEAEATLSRVAATTAPREASQADDLLGVLAWGAPAPAGVLDPADQAVQAFTNAAR